jgi:hypothetical protein
MLLISVDHVAVVPVVPGEEPGAEVRDRAERIVGGAQVVAGDKIRVSEVVGKAFDLVSGHELLVEQPRPGLCLEFRPERVESAGQIGLDHGERQFRWDQWKSCDSSAVR